MNSSISAQAGRVPETEVREQTRHGVLAVSVVGVGGFGTLHTSVLAESTYCELDSLCDTDRDRAEALAERNAVPRVYTEFSDVLHSDVDAVFLVVPEPLHYDYARQVLEAGKHCFVEKPMSLVAAEARELVEIARAAHLRLQVGHVLRYDAQHALLRESVGSGALGDIVSIRAKRNLSSGWATGGLARVHVALENLVHDVDQILWLLDGARCRKVYALQRHVGASAAPNYCAALLQFEAGVVAAVETGWTIPAGAPLNVDAGSWRGHIDAELEVAGTQGAARVEDFRSGVTVWSDRGTVSPGLGLWPRVHGRVEGALKLQDEHFLRCLAQGEADDVTSLADVIHGLDILNAIEESALSGHEVEL